VTKVTDKLVSRGSSQCR